MVLATFISVTAARKKVIVNAGTIRSTEIIKTSKTGKDSEYPGTNPTQIPYI